MECINSYELLPVGIYGLTSCNEFLPDHAPNSLLSVCWCKWVLVGVCVFVSVINVCLFSPAKCFHQLVTLEEENAFFLKLW